MPLKDVEIEVLKSRIAGQLEELVGTGAKQNFQQQYDTLLSMEGEMRKISGLFYRKLRELDERLDELKVEQMIEQEDMIETLAKSYNHLRIIQGLFIKLLKIVLLVHFFALLGLLCLPAVTSLLVSYLRYAWVYGLVWLSLSFLSILLCFLALSTYNALLHAAHIVFLLLVTLIHAGSLLFLVYYYASSVNWVTYVCYWVEALVFFGIESSLELVILLLWPKASKGASLARMQRAIDLRDTNDAYKEKRRQRQPLLDMDDSAYISGEEEIEDSLPMGSTGVLPGVSTPQDCSQEYLGQSADILHLTMSKSKVIPPIGSISGLHEPGSTSSPQASP